MWCQELDIYLYIYMYRERYDPLDNRYGFSISVQPEIYCTTFHSFFSMFEKKKFFKVSKVGKSVNGWWLIMLGFMDLRWPRVFRRSNVGLVYLKLFVACRLCVIYVREDNDFNVLAMITRLVWTTWTWLSAVPERPLNLITYSLTHYSYDNLSMFIWSI